MQRFRRYWGISGLVETCVNRALMTRLRHGRSKLAVMHNSSAEVNGLVYESDVFEKRAGQWRLVSQRRLAGAQVACFNIAEK
jgi:hypothetical protein